MYAVGPHHLCQYIRLCQILTLINIGCYYYYHPHFTAKKTKLQGGKTTYLV